MSDDSQQAADREAAVDASLLARVAIGDREAFAQLYERTSSRVYALLLNMLGNRAQADDVLQEVYLKAWYSADAFNRSRGKPIAWLITIARNRAIDVLRGQARLASGREDVFDQAYTPPEIEGRLDDCVAGLEDQQRQSIFAAFYHGLTHSEMAARFAEPIGTIKSRVRRGLAALRECLEA